MRVLTCVWPLHVLALVALGQKRPSLSLPPSHFPLSPRLNMVSKQKQLWKKKRLFKPETKLARCLAFLRSVHLLVGGCVGVFGWCCYAHPSPCPVGVGAYGQIPVGGFSLDTTLWVVESKSTEKWLQVIHPRLKQGKAKVNLY